MRSGEEVKGVKSGYKKGVEHAKECTKTDLAEARKQGARDLAEKIRKSNKADDFYISFTDKDLDDLLKELEG